MRSWYRPIATGLDDAKNREINDDSDTIGFHNQALQERGWRAPDIRCYGCFLRCAGQASHRIPLH